MSDIQDYKKQGYYIANGIIPMKLLQKTLCEMDIILVQQLKRFNILENPSASLEIIYQHMLLLYQQDQFVYIQSLKLWSKLFSLQALVMHENIAEITKKLGIMLPVFQTTPVLHVMSNDLKITGGYHGVGVHQDWPALQSGLDTVIVWFPFMNVDASNFPLELIPGSHKHGLYPGKISDHIFEVTPSSYNEGDFLQIKVNLGDVLFMSSFILHRSGLNGSRLRIACSSRYENACEETFIERAYPSAQKRIIQRELIDPDFPLATHFSRIY